MHPASGGDQRGGQRPNGDRGPEHAPEQEPLRRRARQAPKREVPRDHPSHQADESGGPQPADSQPAQRRAAIDRCEQDMLNIRRLEHQRTAPRA